MRTICLRRSSGWGSQRLINWKTSCVCFNSLFCYAIETPAAGHVRQRWKRRGGSAIFRIVQQTASTHSFLHLKIPERGNLPAAHRKACFFTHQRKGAHRQWPKDSTLKDAGRRRNLSCSCSRGQKTIFAMRGSTGSGFIAV